MTKFKIVSQTGEVVYVAKFSDSVDMHMMLTVQCTVAATAFDIQIEIHDLIVARIYVDADYTVTLS